ncbi:MAG: nucleotidyltransferase domain-containing protein [Deltaproteobacteria bacterium]|nr:nucleotidyltransferase domain-containing protein [Deltaproteobacteria bacterium]
MRGAVLPGTAIDAEAQPQVDCQEALVIGCVPMARSPNVDSTLRSVAEVLAAFPIIGVAAVFGSAASGRAGPHSDVDVAVAATRPLLTDELLSIREALARKLGREIDLVDLSQVHGLIVTQALSKGRIVVSRDRPLLVRLMKEIVYYEADLAPLVLRSLQLKAERFAHGSPPGSQEA